MKRFTLPIATLAVLALAGCSGAATPASTSSSTTTSTTTTTTPVATPQETVTVEPAASATPWWEESPAAEASADASVDPYASPSPDPSDDPLFRAPGTDANGDAKTVAKFGQVVTFDGGMQVSLTQLKPVKPGESSTSYEDYPQHVVQDITLTNTSTTPFDTSSFYAVGRSANNKDAHRYFDTELKGDPKGTIAPGKSVTFQLGWDTFDPKTLHVTLRLDRTHDSVTFAP